MSINQIFTGIIKQVEMISNGKYLNKAIKTEAVATMQIVYLTSQKNLILTGFHFLSYKINLKAIRFFGKIVIN